MTEDRTIRLHCQTVETDYVTITVGHEISLELFASGPDIILSKEQLRELFVWLGKEIHK